jgi:hypothetical protein
LLKLDAEQEAVAAPPIVELGVRSPVSVNRALVTKCAQRASASRWRVSARIGPQPHNPASIGRILSRFLGQGGACEKATSSRRSREPTVFLPRAATSTQPSSRHRSAVYRQSAYVSFQRPVVPSTLTPLGALTGFLAPYVTLGQETASERRRCEFSANRAADLG